jgi:hypothetical protein
MKTHLFSSNSKTKSINLFFSVNMKAWRSGGGGSGGDRWV